MVDADNTTFEMDNKVLYFPGSSVTWALGFFFAIGTTAVFSFILFDLFIIEDMSYLVWFLQSFIPILLIPAMISYACFSFRIGIKRNRDSVKVWKQLLIRKFQFDECMYPVDSLHADERTVHTYDNGGEITITTLFSGSTVVMSYHGHKQVIEELIPELIIEQSESSRNTETSSNKAFWLSSD